MNQLDVYSDVICPWCYIGKQHMQQRLGVAGSGRPALPGRLAPVPAQSGHAEGRRARATSIGAAKFGSLARSRELDQQVAEAARAAGIEIRHDRMLRTPNTMDAHRLIRWAGEQGRQDALVDRLFEAYFAEGQDIGDRAVLAEAAAAAGLGPRRRRVAYLESDSGEAEVAAEDAAVRAGRAQRRADLRAGPPRAVLRRRPARRVRRSPGKGHGACSPRGAA